MGGRARAKSERARRAGEEMIDSHIHLDADQYDDVAGLIKRAQAAGVEAVVVPGTDPYISDRSALGLSMEFPLFVYPALGFHPERYDLNEDDANEFMALCIDRCDSVCAIGEVGLPYYGEQAARADVKQQARRNLAMFADMAVDLELPLILHCPHETAAEALRIIRDVKVLRAVFHWHKSDEATTRAILQAGYFISLTPEVVYRERDQALARIVPLSQMMVETDGPWPYKGPFAGRMTEPTMVADTVAAIAAIKGESVDEVARATTMNAQRLFGI